MYRNKFLILSVLLTFGSCIRNTDRAGVTEMDTIPHERIIGGLMVKGKVIDNQTRCSHYHTDLDIIAIKFKCCDTYFPCYSCHKETANHEAITWPENEWNNKAILCGVCGHELTVKEYMNSNNTCPLCQSSFNPNCKKHYDLYFTMN